jgi:hypothetical protein
MFEGAGFWEKAGGARRLGAPLTVPRTPQRDCPLLAWGIRQGTIRAKRSSSVGPSRVLILEPSWNRTKAGIRSHIFRAWTACAVLAAYVYGWLYIPEVLTWWKRTTTAIIEAGCNLLPYPWGDRIEATLGNFGLWVQITLAIIVFRILMWLVILAVRRAWAARNPQPDRSQSLRAEGSE